MKNKNLLFGIIIVVVIVLAGLFLLVKPGKETENIRLASLLPLDGQVAAYGEMMRNGQILAMEDINQKKQEKDPGVEILFYNTSHKKDVALDRLKEAHRNRIDFIVEIFGSDQVEHCLQYLIQNEMLCLSGVDTKPDLVEKGKGAFYRIMPHDAAATDYILKWIDELDIRDIAILYANDDWGQGLLAAAKKNSEKYKINIISTRDISRNQPSFAAVVSQLKNANPHAVLLFVYPDDGGNFLKEAKRQGMAAKYFATENFTGENMVNTAKDAAEGVMLVVPSTAGNNLELAAFQTKYEGKYGTKPTIFAIKGYDAVQVLYKIALASGSDISKAKTLLKTFSMEGISGSLSFDDSGEFVPSDYERLKFEKSGETYESKPIVKK